MELTTASSETARISSTGGSRTTTSDRPGTDDDRPTLTGEDTEPAGSERGDGSKRRGSNNFSTST